MLAKRIIPCLDVRDGVVVKGVRFEGLTEQGDPAELAFRYEDEGADEIVFLDISATSQGRIALLDAVRRTACRLSIPLSVGGGIKSVVGAEALFRNGADKVSVNTAAIERPALLRELAEEFGNQSIIAAVDAKKEPGGWRVYSRAGRLRTDLTAGDWCKTAQELGAGEILLTSIDSDGVQKGFDLPLLREVCTKASVPVIASGGAGKPEDFLEALKIADAALAASTFHTKKIRIPELKRFLKEKGLVVRI